MPYSFTIYLYGKYELVLGRLRFEHLGAPTRERKGEERRNPGFIYGEVLFAAFQDTKKPTLNRQIRSYTISENMSADTI